MEDETAIQYKGRGVIRTKIGNKKMSIRSFLLELLRAEDMTRSQIYKKFGIPMSTLSGAFKDLIRQGIVDSYDGRKPYRGRPPKHYTLVKKLD